MSMSALKAPASNPGIPPMVAVRLNFYHRLGLNTTSNQFAVKHITKVGNITKCEIRKPVKIVSKCNCIHVNMKL